MVIHKKSDCFPVPHGKNESYECFQNAFKEQKTCYCTTVSRVKNTVVIRPVCYTAYSCKLELRWRTNHFGKIPCMMFFFPRVPFIFTAPKHQLVCARKISLEWYIQPLTKSICNNLYRFITTRSPAVRDTSRPILVGLLNDELVPSCDHWRSRIFSKSAHTMQISKLTGRVTSSPTRHENKAPCVQQHITAQSFRSSLLRNLFCQCLPWYFCVLVHGQQYIRIISNETWPIGGDFTYVLCTKIIHRE